MKTIISMTIAISVPTLAYFGFTLPNEGMSNVAHTMAWIYFVLTLLLLAVKKIDDIAAESAKAPPSKIQSLINSASRLISAVLFIYFGSIATGLALLFCASVGSIIKETRSKLQATGE